jgi:hypothetical protein
MEEIIGGFAPQPDELRRFETISSDTDTHNWSSDIETQLKNIETNCAKSADISKKEYLELTNQIKYFRIPVIFLSSINAIASVSLNSYMNQSSVSIITCLVSFSVSLISSIELYLGLQKKIETALSSYRDYYLLSVKINNCLRLDRDHRNENDARNFLTECLTEYEQLFEKSNITPDCYDDKLVNIKAETKVSVPSFNKPVLERSVNMTTRAENILHEKC